MTTCLRRDGARRPRTGTKHRPRRIRYVESSTHWVCSRAAKETAVMDRSVVAALHLDIETDYAVSDEVWARALAALDQAMTGAQS